jgi:hypothetical protein
MPTIRITTGCTLPPARILHAAYDFGPDRTLVWPAVHAEHLTVHQLGETTADATEGPPSASASTGNDATTTGPNPAWSRRR